jgi:hypothetical protein
MKEKSVSFLRVAPSVQWTRGQKYGLLVDYSKNRYQQVPLGVIEVLDAIDEQNITRNNLSQMFGEFRERVDDYVKFLIVNKWAFELTDIFQYQNIKSIVSRSQCYRHKNLYISHFLIDQQLVKRISEIVDRFFFSNFICVLDNTVSCLDDSFTQIMREVRDLGFHHIGVFLNGATLDESSLKGLSSACDGLIYNSNRSEKVPKATAVNTLNIGDEEFVDTNRFYVNRPYQLEINGEVSVQSVDAYIAPQFILYPHPYERFYKVAETDDWADLISNIHSRQMHDYWSLKRSDVHGCNNCEYRKICSNKLWFRENSSDLHSRPTNCDQLRL